MKYAFTVFTLLLAFTASAFEFTGKVVSVADGDTITVLYGKKEYKIRFLHIDCPESSQAFGTKAKQVLSNKVFGKTVTVRWTDKDRYKRILGDVYVGQRWINVEMVNEGMAWHYKFFSKDASIGAAQAKARAARSVSGHNLTLWLLGSFVVRNHRRPRPHRRKGQTPQKSSRQRAARSITVTDAIHCPSQSSSHYSQKQRPQVMRLASRVILRSNSPSFLPVKVLEGS